MGSQTKYRANASGRLRHFAWLLPQDDGERLLLGVGVAIGLFAAMLGYNTSGTESESRDLARGFLAQVLGGAVLLLVGVALVRRQIQQEHWFGYKADAYVRIIQDLRAIASWARLKERTHDGADGGLTKDDWERLNAERSEAEVRIDQAIRIGQFVLPDQAVEHLKAFRVEERKLGLRAENDSAWAVMYAGLAESCVVEVERTADVELGVAPHLRGSVPSPLHGFADREFASTEEQPNA